MRKIFTILAIATIAFAYGCGSGSDPKGVADKYVKAFMSFDMKQCAKYATPEYSREILDGIEEAQGMVGKGLYDVMKQGFKEMKFKYVYNPTESEIDENDAWIIYDVKSAIDSSFDTQMTVELEKHNGKWMVSDSEFDMF